MGNKNSAEEGRTPNQQTPDRRPQPPDPDRQAESVTIPSNLRLPNYFVESMKALYTKKGGVVRANDFVSMFKGNMEFTEDLQQFLLSLFRAYDHDGNGIMDISEMLKMLDVVLCGDQKEKVSGIFKMCDFDGDGFITKTELQDFMSSLAWTIQSDETTEGRKAKLLKLADDIFWKFDTDRDGRLTTVEFQEGCLAHKEMKDTVQTVMDICIGKGF